MDAALKLSRWIDRMNVAIGKAVAFLVLFDVLISAGNAVSRYLFSASSNAWLEIQWYMFAAMFLLGAPYTLKVNEHVRVDILYGSLSVRKQAWIDFLGGIFFLMPMALLIAWMAWPFFWHSFVQHEISGNAGGLVRWPVKLMLPLGFTLLALQGVSEIIKNLAALLGHEELHPHYEKPVQ
jgi:TRAP-type mannitol/chloroaromatic compound transport system permease small subunit